MKTYSLAKILNFADGRLLTSIGDIYEFANYMTGDNLFTHQLPRAFRDIKPVLEAQLPWLTSLWFKAAQERLTISLKGSTNPAAEIALWVKELSDKFGAEHAVAPLAEWMQQDPVSELTQMREGKSGIIVVDL